MTPTKTLLDRWLDLLAADATTLAPPALAVRVHLAKAAFTPGPNLTVATFVEADFAGYAAKGVAVGAQPVFTDPITGLKVLQLIEPVGGWSWTTTGLTLLPQSIFGFYVTDDANAVLHGMARFDVVFNLTESGQGVWIPWIRLEMNPQSLK